MNPKYASSLGAAAAVQPNLANPAVNTPQMQNLQNLAAIQFRAGGSDVAQGAFGGEASATADAEAAARAAAQAEEERKLRLRQVELAKQEAENDPKNYTRAVSVDGGYDFYNAKGEKISVGEYSRATGKQIPTALEGSQNQNDTKFSEDYKTLLTYGKAMAGDDDSIKEFTKSEAGKKFLANPDNKNKTYAEVVAAFRNHYDKYMQPGQTNTLTATNASGRDIRSDIVGGTQAGFLTDFLRGKRKNVTYRG